MAGEHPLDRKLRQEEAQATWEANVARAEQTRKEEARARDC